jgi:hypothetical protein
MWSLPDIKSLNNRAAANANSLKRQARSKCEYWNCKCQQPILDCGYVFGRICYAMFDCIKPFPLKRADSNGKFLSLTYAAPRKTKVGFVTCFGLFFFVGSIHAQPLNVAVSSGQFTTYVEAQGVDAQTGALTPPISRTTTSSSPVSDEIDLPYPEYFPDATNHAIANAGLLVVYAQAGWGGADASATSRLLLSTLSDQTQTIGIQLSRGGLSFDGVGSVSLLDLTSNTELWNYSWDYYGPVNFLWDPGSGGSSANFNVDTDFLASDQYELTMIAESQAGDDAGIAQIQLTGLEVVPEPSTTLFLAMCGASLMIFRRQQR